MYVSHCYFDHYQSEDKRTEPLAIGGYLPLRKVYDYELVPEELSKKASKYILGTQANVWTEYIATTGKIEYMLFPPICALAEVARTMKELKDYYDFDKRIRLETQRLKMYGINYRDLD